MALFGVVVLSTVSYAPRTRRAIKWLNWLPKSRIAIWSCVATKVFISPKTCVVLAGLKNHKKRGSPGKGELVRLPQHALLQEMLFFLVICAFGYVVGAVPFSAANTLFGTAIKNGPIQAHTETVVFEHNCTTPPCTITQIHIPSIYPGSGCPFDWESSVLRVYVDGAQTPTIDVDLLMFVAVSNIADAGIDVRKDISPFGARLFGKNAVSGGVWSTVRVPFGIDVRVTLTPPISCDAESGR